MVGVTLSCHESDISCLMRMISLSDTQLQTVMAFAADILPEKRSLFLERLGAMLNTRGRRFRR